MRLLSGIFAALIVSLISLPAYTQVEANEVETGNATSRFFSERTGITPGETILIGFHQRLRKGWHVYWLNPGDSGLPLTIGWQLPAGFSTGEIQYPVPHRLPLDFLVNYGHEGAPTFLIELTAPEDAAVGTMADISAKATWLICDDVCVPEDGEFTLSIPVVSSLAEPDPVGQGIIEMAKSDLPLPADFDASFYDIDGVPVLHLHTDQFDDKSEIHFFPETPSVIEPAGQEIIDATGDGLRIGFTAGFEYSPNALENLPGVLTVKVGRSTVGYALDAQKASAPAGVSAPVNLVQETTESFADADERSAASSVPAQSLLGILALSFLGGIILNIMPCVFPIVFLKAAGIAKVAHQDKSTVRLHGILYTAGVLVTFIALATVLIVLRAGGEQIGWGFHLQSPLVISLFALVIFLVGLNLAGVFEIGTSLQGIGSDLAEKGGGAGAFFTGLLAVAVAAPCIGPFLGVPVGYALVQPAYVGIVVFAVMGLGLAFPYLAISLVPGLATVLPKPGAWMQTFKQLLSFAMFATLIWLIWTLTVQAGNNGLVYLLMALLAAGFAAWLFGKSQTAEKRLFTRLLALVSLVTAGWLMTQIEPVAQRVSANTVADQLADKTTLPTVVFSEDNLARYRAEGVPVFIDFTAAWCVTCQFNKKNVLERSAVVNAFHAEGVLYMVADWTLQDEEISRALEAQGRSGVPLYLFYAPGAENPVVLPQLLSVELMIETFSVL